VRLPAGGVLVADAMLPCKAHLPVL
jgi:hypothetical protein